MGDFMKKLGAVFVKSVPDTSEKGKVDSTDVAKVIRTSVYVALASGLAFALQNMSPETFGPYSVFVIPAATAAIEFLNKLAKGK